MDSLGKLGTNLPAEVAAEKDLQAAFRGAALSLTGLFKVGKKATKKAFLAGKREALSDVLEFVTSLNHPSTTGSPLNAARLIDYICARQETLKAEEEGEADDDADTAPPPATTRPTMFAPRPIPVARPATTVPVMLSPVPSTSSHPSLHHPRSRMDPPSTSPAASSPQHQHASHHAFPTHLSFSSTPFSSASSSASSSIPANVSLPFHPPSSPLALASGVPSPLTRGQARRDRETRDRKGKSTLRDRTRESVGDATSSVAGDFGAAGNLKRRWGSVAVSQVELDAGGDSMEGADDDESGESVSGTDGAQHGEEEMEVEVMEMEGWDGLGERPPKRLTRRV